MSIRSHGSKITPFPRRSVVTMMFLHPSDSGSSTIKSIESSCQQRSGMGRGFRSPCRRLLHIAFAPQLSQFRTKRRTSSAQFGQKNWRASRAYMLSRPGCPVSAESCISCRILVRSGSESGTQRLSLKRSSPFVLREHSDMETLTPVPAGKVRCPSRTAVVSLAKASSCSLASFHCSSMGSSVDGSNSMVSLLSPWGSGPAVSLLSPWSSGSTISASSGGLSVEISCWRDWALVRMGTTRIIPWSASLKIPGFSSSISRWRKRSSSTPLGMSCSLRESVSGSIPSLPGL